MYYVWAPDSQKAQQFLRLVPSVCCGSITSPWSLHSVVAREAHSGTPKGLTSGALFLEPLELWNEQGNMFPQGNIPGK